jgi:dienelactone hydrolase
MIAIVGRVVRRIGVLTFLFTVLAGRASGAPDVRLWGTLVPGPHPVGFARSWQLDHARRYAPEFRAEGAALGPAPDCPRPILISLWYPARASAAAPMRYRDYLEIGSDDPAIAPFARRLDAFTRQTIAEEVLEERPAKIDDAEAAGIKRWLDATTCAVKDAPVAQGKFPLIVAHPGLGGTFEDNSVFYEYMASHGYVVIVSAYQSEDASFLNIDWDLDRSIKEMDFLIRYAKARPGFNLGAIGAIGHSYGAQAVLAWRAENNSPLGAVVSLDSTVEYNDADDPGYAPLKARFASPERLAGPIMAYASKDEKPQFLPHWRHLKFTHLYTAAVPYMEHSDFVSQGAARFAFLPGRKTPPEKAAAIRAGYDRVCLNTRRFFDAYLKGDRDAELFLKQTAQDDRTQAAGWDVTIREPAPSPPTAGQLMDLVFRDGIDAAMRVARPFGRDLTEGSLADAGAGLITAGKPAEGMALMRYCCELYPASWGAQLRLANRLLEDGDRTGALAGFRRAQEMIASGAKPPPSERSRKMIANGISKAEGK